MTDNEIISKEIHLIKRPIGFVNEDDFELVEVKVPEIIKKVSILFAICGFQ